jgi:16S rRNA (uracil1498-N3)-methyltransferase
VRGTAAHVFVDDLALPSLVAEDFHHLSRVLRLRPGEAVSASDGRGRWRVCSWQGSAQLSPLAEVVAEAAPTPVLSVAFALTKGEKPEWAVQKLTEVGLDRIVLITSARCVVRWNGERAAGRLARLRAVAREAAMQSRRLWLPTVEGPIALDDLVSGRGRLRRAVSGSGRVPGAGDDPPEPGVALAEPGVALAEPGGGPLTLATPTVVVGPEGGWTDEELAVAPVRVGLGPNVLRAETAAMVAGAMLVALRAGLVAPARL